MWYKSTLRQNVYACARLRISGHFFSHTFQSDPIKDSPARSALFCVQLVIQFLCFMLLVCLTPIVVIEIAYVDNEAQITETISRLDSEKGSW